MEYIKDEKEISIKELIVSVLLQWKKILIVGVIAILIVVIGNISEAIKYIDILGAGKVVKILLKQSIIYGILAAVACGGYYAAVYLFTDNIKSVNDFVGATNIPVIGCIPDSKNKGRIDRLIKKIVGVRLYKDNRDEYIAHIAKTIEADLMARNVSKTDVACVVSSGVENATSLVKAIDNKMSADISLVNAGDINVSSEGVSAVMQTKYIILLEQEGASKYRELKHTCQKLSSWNKDILGAVLVDVDSI